MKKVIFIIIACLSLTFCLASCGGNSDSAGDDVKVIKMGTPDPSNEHGRFTYTINYLNAQLDEICDGKIQFQEIPAGQLGTETDMLNGMKDGSVDSAMLSVDTFASQIPDLQILSLPYLASYPGQLFLLLDDEAYMAELTATLNNDWNIEILGGAMYNGSRNIIGSKKINSLADMKDYTVRITTSTIAQDAFDALGANPTVVAFNECYTALSQGTVDAINCPAETDYIMNFQEVAKSYCALNMLEVYSYPLISKNTWESLSEEERGWITEAAEAAVAYERKEIFKSEEEVLNIMKKENGITVTEPDTTEFKKATLSVHEKWWDEFGDDLMRKTYDILDKDNAKKGYELWSDIWEYKK